MRVFITGGNGFVGKALCERLSREGFDIQIGYRSVIPERISFPNATAVPIGDIGKDTSWAEHLRSVDIVIHLAARVHILKDHLNEPLKAYRETNVLGTKRLVQESITAGVRRFIFMSSIKVNGESSVLPLSESDSPAPEDAYGISKWEAEQTIRETVVGSTMEYVILRPPLMYGPGVKANFYRLIRAVEKGIPFPLKTVNSRRSMLYLGNLIDAIRVCMLHQAAGNETFLISDGEDISVVDLVEKIGRNLGKHARLIAVPQKLLLTIGRLTGYQGELRRLLTPLQIDNRKIRTKLTWDPPFSLEEGLRDTVKWYMHS